jgi:hypothetical protein
VLAFTILIKYGNEATIVPYFVFEQHHADILNNHL